LPEATQIVTPLQNPEFVYKVVTRASFAAGKAGTEYRGMPIDLTDGFVHLSGASQVPETLSLHYRGQRNLLLLAVRTDGLGDALRWEPSRGGALFPHLYAPLPLAAIAWIAPIEVADDGSCALPEVFQ
jgi:uncharacterized protein (DUF952 family)